MSYLNKRFRQEFREVEMRLLQRITTLFEIYMYRRSHRNANA